MKSEESEVGADTLILDDTVNSTTNGKTYLSNATTASVGDDDIEVGKIGVTTHWSVTQTKWAGVAFYDMCLRKDGFDVLI